MQVLKQEHYQGILGLGLSPFHMPYFHGSVVGVKVKLHRVLVDPNARGTRESYFVASSCHTHLRFSLVVEGDGEIKIERQACRMRICASWGEGIINVVEEL